MPTNKQQQQHKMCVCIHINISKIIAQRKGIVVVIRGLQVQIAGQVKGYQRSWLVDVLIAKVKFTVTNFMNSHRKLQMPSGVWVPAQMLLSIEPDIGLYPQPEESLTAVRWLPATTALPLSCWLLPVLGGIRDRTPSEPTLFLPLAVQGDGGKG